MLKEFGFPRIQIYEIRELITKKYFPLKRDKGNIISFSMEMQCGDRPWQIYQQQLPGI